MLSFALLYALSHAVSLTGATPIASGRNSSCLAACESLEARYPNHVVFRNDTADYNSFLTGFWAAQQREVKPYCIFSPQTAEEVGAAVIVSRQFDCPFAARSGGHAVYAGASSIEDGLDIDLKSLNQITIADDKKSVSVGAGNKWGTVYETLDQHSLGVVGGRVSSIGVGGLTLGGGFSFLSNKYGMACDNVLNYELVSADGIVLHVNQQSHPDLYWALRGGGNNFGIVTRFDLAAYPLGNMWGGNRIHYWSTYRDELLSAFLKFGSESSTDPDASLIFDIIPQPLGVIGYVALEHLKPVVDPPIFEDFLAIPALVDITAISSIANLSVEQDTSNSTGIRKRREVLTFKLEDTLPGFIADVYIEETDTLLDIERIIPSATLQIVSQGILENMSKRGGNPFNLDPAGGPYFEMDLVTQWLNAADDERINTAYQNIVSRVKAKAQELGVQADWIHMNYAGEDQDPIASYGAANQKRLQEISLRYDPEQVFQKLQPGYHKLY